MKTVYLKEQKTTPELYLKKMLESIDEKGNLLIARNIDDASFRTAESKAETTKTEKFAVNAKLADYDAIYKSYTEIIDGLENGTYREKTSSEYIGKNKYGDRVDVFARRIKKVKDLNAPDFIVNSERCMLIDSLVLFKLSAKETD